MKKTLIVRLIYTTEKKGRGTDQDPVRLIHQLWTKDGDLVAAQDPFLKESFFQWLRPCKVTVQKDTADDHGFGLGVMEGAVELARNEHIVGWANEVGRLVTENMEAGSVRGMILGKVNNIIHIIYNHAFGKDPQPVHSDPPTEIADPSGSYEE